MIRLITANFDITEGTNKGFSSLESGGLKHTSAPQILLGAVSPSPPLPTPLTVKEMNEKLVTSMICWKSLDTTSISELGRWVRSSQACFFSPIRSEWKLMIYGHLPCQHAHKQPLVGKLAPVGLMKIWSWYSCGPHNGELVYWKFTISPPRPLLSSPCRWKTDYAHKQSMWAPCGHDELTSLSL